MSKSRDRVSLLRRLTTGQTVRRFRPLRRRRLITALPARVLMRTRKPWVFFRLRLFGWYVLFTSTYPRHIRNPRPPSSFSRIHITAPILPRTQVYCTAASSVRAKAQEYTSHPRPSQSYAFTRLGRNPLPPTVRPRPRVPFTPRFLLRQATPTASATLWIIWITLPPPYSRPPHSHASRGATNPPGAGRDTPRDPGAAGPSVPVSEVPGARLPCAAVSVSPPSLHPPRALRGNAHHSRYFRQSSPHDNGCAAPSSEKKLPGGCCPSLSAPRRKPHFITRP